MSPVREAMPDELERWDETAVDGPGGHVLQSLAWAAHRAATGWRPHHLVTDDGAHVLALSRSWPVLPGGSAYVPRGPVPDGAPAGRLAARLADVTDHLATGGIDVVASDAEVRTDAGYGEAIRAGGFHPIEEIQPSRHTMAIALGPGVDEAAVRSGIAKSTRARLRAAEDAGLVVRRHDRDAAATARPALESFFDLETATASRRGFSLGPRHRFIDWWMAALAAGHLVYLEAAAPDEPAIPIGGIVLYRHGRRLTAVQSADRYDQRSQYPGVLHLLRWRAIQLAIEEGREEMDLGGADGPGVRRQPRPGEPLYGLYEHKAAFGARWIEQCGAHERVIRPARYAIGRLATRIGRLAGGPA